MAFAKDMLEIQKKLKKLGHKATIPFGTEPHLKDSNFVESLQENLEYCIKNNVMKKNFDMILEHDAVLVLNKKRKGIDGYIGISALMEMAIAHHNNKKIFLYQQVPHFDSHRFAHEVMIMQPVAIESDLKKIK